MLQQFFCALYCALYINWLVDAIYLNNKPREAMVSAPRRT